jgi:hypothetical protein
MSHRRDPGATAQLRWCPGLTRNKATSGRTPRMPTRTRQLRHRHHGLPPHQIPWWPPHDHESAPPRCSPEMTQNGPAPGPCNLRNAAEVVAIADASRAYANAAWTSDLASPHRRPSPQHHAMRPPQPPPERTQGRCRGRLPCPPPSAARPRHRRRCRRHNGQGGRDLGLFARVGFPTEPPGARATREEFP